jgi:putative ABC transport system permease protein
MAPDTPPYVSSLELIAGRYPQTPTEIVVLDTLAYAEGVGLNDVLTLFHRAGNVDYQIVGLIKSIEYSAFELSQSGVAFLTFEGMERLNNRAGLEGLANEIAVYFEYDISQDDLIDLSDHIKEKLQEDEINVVLFWFVRETSFRKALLDALNLTSQYMAAASIFIFLVAGVVIFVVTNRYITEQKTRIGAMYSFGVRRRQIMYSFFVRMFILGIIAIAIGLAVSKVLIGLIIQTLVEQWGLIGYADDISQTSIIFTLTSAALVSYFFTFLGVANLIKLTPYEAMRGKTTELKNRGLLFKFSGVLPTRTLRGAAKNLTRNRTRTALTIVAFLIAMTFSGSLLYTNDSIGQTITDFYDDRVDYDIEVDIGYDLLGTPSNGIATDIMDRPEVRRGEYFANSLVQLGGQPDTLTYMLGFYRNTTMYDFGQDNLLEGRWHEFNSSDIVISRYLQGSEGINMGDDFSFDFFGVRFNGTVVGITNDIQWSTAFFVDFDYINHLVNTRYFSFLPQDLIIADKLLLQLQDDVDVQEFQDDLNTNNRDVRLAQTLDSYVRRSVALSESQTAVIFLMVALGLVVGVVSVFTTLLIAVVERERELALLGVFGYKRSELRFQLLLEGWIIGLIAIIPTFFTSRIVAEQLWVPIISDNIYQIFPVYPTAVTLFLTAFAFGAITLSIIPAFRSAVSTKLSEAIREE